MIEFQQKLLGDRERNRAFHEALSRVIVKGKTTVADIGSGTGFLSFLASKLGAKTCYLYETSEAMAELSQKLAHKNNVNNCTVVGAHSTQIKSPPKVDVVISETLGNFALEENIIETLADARRFLKPGGVMMPQELRQFAAPVTSKRFIKEIDVWSEIGFGLQFDEAREVALNNMYVWRAEPRDLLPGAEKQWDEIDFRKKNSSRRSGTVSWSVPKATPIYGFCVWWECVLIPGISLSTSPYKTPTHWDQIFLPLIEPFSAAAGDRLDLTIHSDSRYEVGIRVQWEAAVLTKGKTTVRCLMDTQRGMI